MAERRPEVANANADADAALAATGLQGGPAARKGLATIAGWTATATGATLLRLPPEKLPGTCARLSPVCSRKLSLAARCGDAPSEDILPIHWAAARNLAPMRSEPACPEMMSFQSPVASGSPRSSDSSPIAIM